MTSSGSGSAITTRGLQGTRYVDSLLMNEALKDPDVQRMGVVVINDLNGLKLKVRTSEPWRYLYATLL